MCPFFGGRSAVAPRSTFQGEVGLRGPITSSVGYPAIAIVPSRNGTPTYIFIGTRSAVSGRHRLDGVKRV